jgi:hypothetical protein
VGSWIPVLVGALSIVVVAYLIIGWTRNRMGTRAEISAAMSEGNRIHAEVGGAILNGVYSTTPFASIVISDRGISVIVFGRVLRFRRSDVVALSRHRSPMLTGLRVRHRRSDAPELVVFRPMDKATVLL